MGTPARPGKRPRPRPGTRPRPHPGMRPRPTSWHEAPPASWHEAPPTSWHEAPPASYHEAPPTSWHEAPPTSWHEALPASSPACNGVHRLRIWSQAPVLPRQSGSDVTLLLPGKDNFKDLSNYVLGLTTPGDFPWGRPSDTPLMSSVLRSGLGALGGLEAVSLAVSICPPEGAPRGAGGARARDRADLHVGGQHPEVPASLRDVLPCLPRNLGPVTCRSVWAPADRIQETGRTGEGPPVGGGAKCPLLRPAAQGR